MSSTSSFSCYPIYKKSAFLGVVCSYIFELSRCFSVCMSGHVCVTLASTWVGVVVVFTLLDVSFFQKWCVPISSTVKSIKKKDSSPRNSKSKEEKELCIGGLHKAVLLSHMRRPSFGAEGRRCQFRKKKERERIERSDLRREEKRLCFVCLFAYLFV